MKTWSNYESPAIELLFISSIKLFEWMSQVLKSRMHQVDVAVAWFYLYYCLKLYLSYQIDFNFACLMNLYPCFLNWLQAGIAYELLMVFLWLFSCTSNGVPALATYWILHKVHWIKYNILLLSQFSSQKCFLFFFAW